MGSKQTTEEVLGAVDWLNDWEGNATCPGQDLHSHRTGPRDCRVYLDKVPTIYCVHQSCLGEVEKANRQLRKVLCNQDTGSLTFKGSQLAGGFIPVTKAHYSPKDRREYLRRKSRERQLKSAGRKQLERILNDPVYQWEYDQILADSPLAPGHEPIEDWHLFLGLFEGMEGSLWCGDVTDSGQEHHSENFKPTDEWLLSPEPPGAFTCSALFAPGTTSRRNANVTSRPYLVMESDKLTKGQMGAVLRWFNVGMHWPLRAIIDTGGKSLHGWMDMPPQEWLPELQIIVEAMDMDPAMLKPSQPVRLPGVPRDNKFQRLIYYAPRHQSR